MSNVNHKKVNIVPLKELNLTDRFLFDEVMEDPETQQAALSIIFEREIPLLTRSETEKELRLSPGIRSVRMDVFAMDEEQNIYNTEMQNKRKSDLARRSRYYQALLDTSLLENGIPNYNLLNDTYFVMIMPFDLFGRKKYRYTFRSECQELPGLLLEDGAVRVFLNTRGEDKEGVSRELIDFLHYLENTTDEAAEQASGERIRKIHSRVRKVKSNEEIGVKYMQAWEERYYDKQEAREEGREEGARAKLREMVEKKLRKGQSPEQIADALEEEQEVIRDLLKEIQQDRGE
ncbi:MAG: Rpn family recombination-promoting nuclease/putative transposase [Lachnospiraceae bacterium]|nr:Rpn family recombination-promoting nuclease/putative transposase [Lachnospiraceae bacterium]